MSHESTVTPTTTTGTVKWYSLAKGYGFIESEHEGAGQDIFVHYSDVAGEALVEGESVCFELVDSPKGLKAQNVTRAHRVAC
ncbi:MAG: cold shock domain-containing protein [Acidobacteriota bacterium]